MDYNDKYCPDWVDSEEHALKFAYHLNYRLNEQKDIADYLMDELEKYLNIKIYREIQDKCSDISLHHDHKYSATNATYVKRTGDRNEQAFSHFTP